MKNFHTYDFFKIYIDIKSAMFQHHGLRNAVLFLNYFVPSPYDEYLINELDSFI